MLQFGRHIFTVERRSVKRRKSFIPAIFTSQHIPQHIYLLNVTTEGALGYALEPGAVGTIGKLEVGDVHIKANIVWLRGSSFGIRFAEPLEASVVEKLLNPRRPIANDEGGRLSLLRSALARWPMLKRAKP